MRAMRLWLLMLWNYIDPLYYSFTRLTCLTESDGKVKERNVFRVRLTRYKGADVVLSDGIKIKHNDILLKIHLHNVEIMKELKQFRSEFQKVRWLYQAVERSLPELAAYIRAHKHCDNIRGIIGITLLDNVSYRLGFDTIAISNPIYKFIKWVTQIPIYYLTTSQFSWKMLMKHQPNYLFMSKDSLFEKYGK